MAEGPAYAIVGRGRWAGRMRAILAGENRRVVEIVETRQIFGETDEAYRARLAEKLHASGAGVAWLCVLPGPHVVLMMDAALDAGLHVVAEKPWLCSRHVTEALASRARATNRVVGIHYEYCLLDEVQSWRATFFPGSGLRFRGHFFLNRRDHTGMDPMDNLGSHLLAICMYAVPQSAIEEIRCGYEQPDERVVWLERHGKRAALIDLLENKQPIIQRFMGRMENAIEGAEFPLNLDFAMTVADEVGALK